MPSIKPGHRTTEFLLTALGLIALVATALQGSLPPKWAAIAGAISVAAYSISRGITKTAAKTTVVQQVAPTAPPA